MNIGYLFPSNKLGLMSTTRSKDKNVTYKGVKNTSGCFLVWLKEDTCSEDHCFCEDLWKWKWIFSILWLRVDISGTLSWHSPTLDNRAVSRKFMIVPTAGVGWEFVCVIQGVEASDAVHHPVAQRAAPHAEVEKSYFTNSMPGPE